MKKTFCIIILVMAAGLTGCGIGPEEPKESELALIKTTNPRPTLIERNTKEKLDLVESIKEDISSMDEVYDVAVVKGKKDTLVAYKVKHLHRFQMKKIEKRMTDMLEKKYQDEEFTVSSDYKIFLEAVKLNEKMKDPNFSNKEANQKLQEIIKLKQEMA